MTEIQLRRGTAAAWTSANTVLAQGEAGVETDTHKVKVGDGSTAWASLPYVGGSAVNNADGTLSVNGLDALEPLSTVTILTTSTSPAIGQTTYYNATSGNLTPTLPALSGLNVGARLAVRRDPADVSPNTVTLSCAGSDTFYSSGGGSTTLPMPGEQREYQVISVSGTKYWAPAGALNPVAALDNRYLANVRDPSKLLVVADNGWGTEAISVPTSTVGTSAYTYTMGMNVTGIVLKYAHAYANALLDADPAGPITFNVSVAVTSSSNPNVTLNLLFPVTFGGKKIVALDPGAVILSDPLPIQLNTGDQISVRSFLISGTAYPYKSTSPLATNGGGFTATTDLTPPGSAAVASTLGYYLSPSEILGYPDTQAKVTALGLIGDSIAFAGADSGAQFSSPLLGQGGYGIRALTGRGGLVNLAYSGDTMINFLRTSGTIRRLRSLRDVNAVLCEYGVNDLAVGQSAAQLQANILIAGKMVARWGIKKFFIQTLTPRTTSTDGWQTVGGQTAVATDPARVTHNTWVRAGCPIDPIALTPVLPGTPNALLAGSFGHPITGWLEMADLVESSRNSGLWEPCQRVVHINVTSGSNVITLTDATFNTANIEAGGDNGACAAILGWTTPGVWRLAAGLNVLTTTTAALAISAGQTLSGAAMNMNPATADGTHPTSSSCIAMANPLIVRLAAFAN